MMQSVPGSFESDVARFIPNLRAFARSLTRNVEDADDLVQETLIKAFSNFERLVPGSNLKAWLFTILRNTHISHIRKRRNEVLQQHDDQVELVAVKESQSSRMDLLDFTNALETLPEDQREALLLIGAEGFSYEDAALMCGCAVGTIKSRVNRARTKLAEMLDVEEQTQSTSSQLSA